MEIMEKVEVRGLFEVLGIKKRLEDKGKEQNEYHDKGMESSQIELMYRGEGNANLVLALPQFKKVLRLPKVMQPREQQQSNENEIEIEMNEYQPSIEQELKSKSEREEHLPESALRTGHQQHRNDNNHLKMEHLAIYIDIIRCVVGNDFILQMDVVDLPNANDKFWINEHIKKYRPDNEFTKRYGLLLPDAAQLPSKFDGLFSNLQGPESTTDTYAIEIKPKQGWILSKHFYDKLDDKLIASKNIGEMDRFKQCPCQPRQVPQHEKTYASNIMYDVVANIGCRYCSMQYLKLEQRRIHKTSSYCPLKLFSGNYKEMLEALDSLFECPQNNLRIFRNGHLIYDDEHNKQNIKIDSIFKGYNVEDMKQLIMKCLLRDYTEHVDSRNEDDSSGNAPLSCTTLTGTTRKMNLVNSETEARAVDETDNEIVAKSAIDVTKSTTTTTGQTDLSVLLESQYLQTSLTRQEYEQVQREHQKQVEWVEWMEQEEQRTKKQEHEAGRGQIKLRNKYKIDGESAITTTEISKRTSRITLPGSIELKQQQQHCGLRRGKSPPLLRLLKESRTHLNKIQNDITEMLRLPKNCVLQKVLYLQLLAKKNMEYMLEARNHEKLDKTYNNIQAMLTKYQRNIFDTFHLSQLSNEEMYLLGATALDCSIMITFRELLSSKDLSSSSRRHLIEMPNMKRNFITNISLLDLDPKSDNHFAKYCKKSIKIANAFKKFTSIK